jgi:hypothetical protein
MLGFPLLHDGSGFLDECILIVEGILALCLYIAFVHSRKRGARTSMPPDDQPAEKGD